MLEILGRGRERHGKLHFLTTAYGRLTTKQHLKVSAANDLTPQAPKVRPSYPTSGSYFLNLYYVRIFNTTNIHSHLPVL